MYVCSCGAVAGRRTGGRVVWGAVLPVDVRNVIGLVRDHGLCEYQAALSTAWGGVAGQSSTSRPRTGVGARTSTGLLEHQRAQRREPSVSCGGAMYGERRAMHRTYGGTRGIRVECVHTRAAGRSEWLHGALCKMCKGCGGTHGAWTEPYRKKRSLPVTSPVPPVLRGADVCTPGETR